jgi:hypothetical protein
MAAATNPGSPVYPQPDLSVVGEAFAVEPVLAGSVGIKLKIRFTT